MARILALLISLALSASAFAMDADVLLDAEPDEAPPIQLPDPHHEVDPFRIVVLPDTQHYTSDQYSHLAIFSTQTRWIAENRDHLNIKFVLHEGDLKGGRATDLIVQWIRAKLSMSILDGVVPYALAVGNHDGAFRNRETILFNAFFPVSQYEDLPSFGGVFEEDKLDNSYHYFRAGGIDWLVLALELGPRDQVLDWANLVVASHPDRQVMIVTHAYLYSDNRLHGSLPWPYHRANPHSYPIAQEEGGVNDGVEIWEKLVRKHENIAFVFNGHIPGNGVGRLVSEGDHGNQVFQMLANYQSYPLGGGGFLRILEFVPRENKVYIKTYSPYLNEYMIDGENQFEYELSIFDTTPPEALVKFDSSDEDIVVIGLDDRDEDVEVNYDVIERGNENGNGVVEVREYVLEDDATNTLVFRMRYEKKRGRVGVEITDLQYNDEERTATEENSFTTRFKKKMRRQRLRLGEDFIGTALYRLEKGDTRVIFGEGNDREKITEDGLIEFNLMTDEGNLTYRLNQV